MNVFSIAKYYTYIIINPKRQGKVTTHEEVIFARFFALLMMIMIYRWGVNSISIIWPSNHTK